MKKTVYLANQYGFSGMERYYIMGHVTRQIESLNLYVHEPFEQIAKSINMDNVRESWYEIGQTNMDSIVGSDAVFAMINGLEPDSGVMIEIGLAYAWNIPVFLFRDDMRQGSETNTYPLNIMIFAGLPKDNWKDHYYTCLADITDPKKALAKWAKDPDSIYPYQ